jgi:hypothetical protein
VQPLENGFGWLDTIAHSTLTEGFTFVKQQSFKVQYIEEWHIGAVISALTI